MNQVALAGHQGLDAAGVIEFVTHHLHPSGTIHQQDIRRAIGQPRTIPTDRLKAVLDFYLKAPTLPSRQNAKGLALRATDLAWRIGHRPEAAGPGEALLMAAAGRQEALDDLTGDGKPVLQRRLEGRRQAL